MVSQTYSADILWIPPLGTHLDRCSSWALSVFLLDGPPFAICTEIWRFRVTQE